MPRSTRMESSCTSLAFLSPRSEHQTQRTYLSQFMSDLVRWKGSQLEPTSRRLLELTMRLDEGTPIVLNCQLGRGRSTMASIVVLLAQQWLQQSRVSSSGGSTKRPGTLSRTLTANIPADDSNEPHQRSYQVINSKLTRVVWFITR
jgi:hypothetical protein